MGNTFSIVSGKGGVGKTFVSINLSYVLANYFDKKVLLVDANITTPNIGVNLRLPHHLYTLHDVLGDKVSIHDAVIKTDYGFDVVLGSLRIQDLLDINITKLPGAISEIKPFYDIIILDSSAGIGKEVYYSISSTDYTLPISTPDKSSLVDVYRVIKLSESMNIPIYGVVINRFVGNSINLFDIEHYLGYPVIGVIKEDSLVRKSLNIGIPFVSLYPNRQTSLDIIKIAARIVGEEYTVEEPKVKKEGILSKLLKIFKR